MVHIEYYDQEALNATLPQKVTCKVVETEPVVKGQTAANSFKPAILDNGVRILVPPFVGQDESVIVNTEIDGICRTRLRRDPACDLTSRPASGRFFVVRGMAP